MDGSEVLNRMKSIRGMRRSMLSSRMWIANIVMSVAFRLSAAMRPVKLIARKKAT